MHTSALFLTVLSLLIFLTAGAVLRLVSNIIRVPFTLLLVVFGIALPLFSGIFHWGETSSFSGAVFYNIAHFTLSPDAVFYIFLPVLVFESAFNLRFAQLKRGLLAISALASITLLLSVGIIAGILYLFTDIPLLPLLVFGALISATDPVSVLAMFKDIGAPRRLRTIIEGESLFNDGTALVIFKIILPFALADVSGHLSLFEGIGDFSYKVFGGILFGSIMGILFSKGIHMVRDNQNVEMTLAIILAHSTFLFAEHIGVSGIIATVAAGIILGNFGRNKISPPVLETMEHLWDHMAFIVNSLVFILIGISIFYSANLSFIFPSLVAIGAVILARFLSVIPVLSLSNMLPEKFGEKVPFSWQVVIAHGGLRGALAVVMLLLLPSNFPYLEALQSMTVAVIIFLFLFNGTTMGWIMKKLGLMKFHATDILEVEESHVLVADSVQEHLKKIRKKRYISNDIYEKIYNNYEKSEKKAISHIHTLFENKKLFSNRELLLILQKHCLGVERKIFHQLFTAEEISERTLGELVASSERQRERLMNKERQEKKSAIPFSLRLKKSEEMLKRISAPIGKFLFFSQWLWHWKKKRIMAKYDRYRARRISAWNVLRYLENLEKHNLFHEGDRLKIVRAQYKKWHQNAKRKQLSLEASFPEFLKNRRIYLTKRNCFSLEKETIEDLRERDIITKKIHVALIKSLEKRMHKIRYNAEEDEEL